jgi:hypothetical protein
MLNGKAGIDRNSIGVRVRDYCLSVGNPALDSTPPLQPFNSPMNTTDGNSNLRGDLWD